MSTELKTVGIWHETPDYRHQYIRTTDPRVLAVVERDTSPEAGQFAFDGDAIVPMYAWSYSGSYPRGFDYDHTGGFESAAANDFAERVLTARIRFREAAGYCYNGLSIDMIMRSEALLNRWARVFHDSTLLLWSPGQGYREMLAFITPEFREHVGMDEGGAGSADEVSSLSALRDEHQKLVDGEVYGIGYAVNTEATEAEDVDLNDWQVDIQCWGFIGENYARQEAASFTYEMPDMEAIGIQTQAMADYARRRAFIERAMAASDEDYDPAELVGLA